MKMKINTLVLLITLLLVPTIQPTISIIPDNEILAIQMLGNYPVHYGKETNMTILIQNFGNHTMKNISITLKINTKYFRIVSTPFGDIPNEKRMTLIASNAASIPGTTLNSDTLLLYSYLSNSTYFNATFNQLEVNNTLEFWYTIKAFKGASVTYPAATITWYDNYGDKQKIRTNTIKMRYKGNPPPNPLEGYLVAPNLEIVDDYKIFWLPALLALIVGLFSQYLYKIKLTKKD